MALKHKCHNIGNLDVPKRSHRVLPLNEKLKVLDLIKKEKNYMLRMLSSVVRANLVSVKLWGKKKKFVLFRCCISNCQSYSHRVWWLLNEDGKGLKGNHWQSKKRENPMKERKYLQMIWLIRGKYSTYINNIQLNIKKKKISLKIGQKWIGIFPKRKCRWVKGR